MKRRMQRRNDIYNKESNQLPRRHRPASPRNGALGNGKPAGLYGNRERPSLLTDDLSGRRHTIPTKPPVQQRRRRSSRGRGGNKWILYVLSAALLGYLVILGVSLYRSGRSSPPVGSELERVETDAEGIPGEEAARSLVEDGEPGFEELAALDAERTGAHLDVFKRAVNELHRSQAEMARRDTSRALERLERALEAAPHVAELKLQLADLYMDEKRFAEARDLYAGALEADPLQKETRLKWAQALHALRHHEAALQVALWILEDDAFWEEPNQIAALAYIAMDRIEEAVPHLRRQVSVNRENMVARNNLAVAYSRLGQYARAVTLFRGVLESDPGNAITYYNLAVCYAQQGHALDAVDMLERAADRFGYSFVSAWFKSRDFDPIRGAEAFQALESEDDLPAPGNQARR